MYLGYLLFLCFTILAMFGCGAKLQQETVYRVEGDATIHVVVGVDVTACQELEAEAKAECIQTLIELAKMLEEGDEMEEGF